MNQKHTKEDAMHKVLRIAQYIADTEPSWKRQYDREQVDLNACVSNPSPDQPLGWRGVSQLSNLLTEWVLQRRSPSQQQSGQSTLQLAGVSSADVASSQSTLHALLDSVPPDVPDGVMRTFAQQPPDLRVLTLAHAASRALASYMPASTLIHLWNMVTVMLATPLPFGMRMWLTRALYETPPVHPSHHHHHHHHQTSALPTPATAASPPPTTTSTCIQDPRTRVMFVRLMGYTQGPQTTLVQWFVQALMETSLFEQIDEMKDVAKLDETVLRKTGDAVRDIVPSDLHSNTLEQLLSPTYWHRSAMSIASGHLQNSRTAFRDAHAILLWIAHLWRVLCIVYESDGSSWRRVARRHEDGQHIWQAVIKHILLPAWCAVSSVHKDRDSAARAFGVSSSSSLWTCRVEYNSKLRDELLHLGRVLHVHSTMTLMQMRRTTTLFLVLLSSSVYFPRV